MNATLYDSSQTHPQRGRVITEWADTYVAWHGWPFDLQPEGQGFPKFSPCHSSESHTEAVTITTSQALQMSPSPDAPKTLTDAKAFFCGCLESLSCLFTWAPWGRFSGMPVRPLLILRLPFAMGSRGREPQVLAVGKRTDRTGFLTAPQRAICGKYCATNCIGA